MDHAWSSPLVKDNLAIKLRTTDSELIISAEDFVTSAKYELTITNEEAANLKIPAITNVENLKEVLLEGLQAVSSDLKVFVTEKSILSLKGKIYFGNRSIEYEKQFKLQEVEPKEPLHVCQDILNNFLPEGLNSAHIVELLQRLVAHNVNVEKRLQSSLGNIEEQIKNMETRFEKIEKYMESSLKKEIEAENKQKDLERQISDLQKEMREMRAQITTVKSHKEDSEFRDTCAKTLQAHANAVRCFELLPTGELASGSWDSTIKIWDMEKFTCIKTLQTHDVYDLQELPTGELASCSSDKTIRVWNVKTGTCLKTLEGHTKGVYCLQLLPSGELISGSEDCTIKI